MRIIVFQDFQLIHARNTAMRVHADYLRHCVRARFRNSDTATDGHHRWPSPCVQGGLLKECIDQAT